MLNCCVSKCPTINLNERNKLNSKNLCIAVSYNKDIIIIIIVNKRLRYLI